MPAGSVPLRDQVGPDTLLPLEEAARLAFPADSGRRPSLLYVGPGTLLSPRSAVKLAYQDGTLTVPEIVAAIERGVLVYYLIDDRIFVTLADLSEYVQTRHDGQINPASGVLGTIYFVGFRNYVKIGFTLGNPLHRMSGLQTAAPERLKLHATMWGTKAAENELHRRFWRHRLNGEWFRNSDTLRAMVQRVRATEWHRNLFPDRRYPKEPWAN